MKARCILQHPLLSYMGLDKNDIVEVELITYDEDTVIVQEHTTPESWIAHGWKGGDWEEIVAPAKSYKDWKIITKTGAYIDGMILYNQLGPRVFLSDIIVKEV